MLGYIVIAIFAYLTAFFSSIHHTRQQSSRHSLLFFVSVIVALFCHAFLLHHWIDTHLGQNLNIANVLSMACWLLILLLVLMAFFRRVSQLLMLALPLALLSLIYAVLNAHLIIFQANTLGKLFHMLCGMLTVSVLSLAALQALLLLVKEYRLKHKAAGTVIHYLPPLDEMESSLFQIIFLGFFLLTLMLVTSVFLFYPSVFHRVFLLSLFIITALAWLIFALLLLGRYYFGWRGKLAIYLTISGVWLVVFVYLAVLFI